jgi:phage tail sheath gpL-like
MAYSERPGVYSSVDVSSALIGSGTGCAVGVAAGAEKGEAGKAVAIASYAEAVSKFGEESEIATLVKILFLNGAPRVYAAAAAVGEEADRKGYSAAIAALMDVDDIGVMLCKAQDEQVHSDLKTALEGANESGKYRVAVIEGAGSVDETVEEAESLNYERLVMVAPGAVNADGEAIEGYAAAAFAGALSGGSDPALPINGAELFGLDGIALSLSDSEVDTLVRGGICPLESVSGEIYVIRGVTTRTKTNGVSDSTWHELTTVMIVNDVIPTVRSALKARFARSKNTKQTRGAIRTQVIIELENKLANEIIDSYDSVTAEASTDDPTLCEVGFEFTVAHGLNRINLSAHITV